LTSPGWLLRRRLSPYRSVVPRGVASTWPTNGQVIATSEAYEGKTSAIKGIESVKPKAPNAEIDD
jgi:hypothetical protein